MKGFVEIFEGGGGSKNAGGAESIKVVSKTCANFYKQIMFNLVNRDERWLVVIVGAPNYKFYKIPPKW